MAFIKTVRKVCTCVTGKQFRTALPTLLEAKHHAEIASRYMTIYMHVQTRSMHMVLGGRERGNRNEESLNTENLSNKRIVSDSTHCVCACDWGL